eukprot:COSAG05_NODE_759_length_7489_cov_110.169959_9_plen_196_part_00
MAITVAPHIPKPMFDCPPQSSTSPQATDSKYAVLPSLSIAITCVVDLAGTPGRGSVATHAPVAWSDCAVALLSTVSPSASSTYTVTASSRLVLFPQILVGASRWRIIPLAKSGAWNRIWPVAPATLSSSASTRPGGRGGMALRLRCRPRGRRGRPHSRRTVPHTMPATYMRQLATIESHALGLQPRTHARATQQL